MADTTPQRYSITDPSIPIPHICIPIGCLVDMLLDFDDAPQRFVELFRFAVELASKGKPVTMKDYVRFEHAVEDWKLLFLPASEEEGE